MTDNNDTMERGRFYSNHPRAGKRAAWKVVQKLVPNLTESQCQHVIDTWIKNGVLYEEEYFDTEQRKPRKGLRVNNAKRPTQTWEK